MVAGPVSTTHVFAGPTHCVHVAAGPVLQTGRPQRSATGASQHTLGGAQQAFVCGQQHALSFWPKMLLISMVWLSGWTRERYGWMWWVGVRRSVKSFSPCETCARRREKRGSEESTVGTGGGGGEGAGKQAHARTHTEREREAHRRVAGAPRRTAPRGDTHFCITAIGTGVAHAAAGAARPHMRVYCGALAHTPSARAARRLGSSQSNEKKIHSEPKEINGKT